ncbi:CD59 glycoprotein isoform X1 [Haplochromis burtoni]|uniref:CD59 molecule (CD59 blood group) b n=1 Tax=Haplochromis burtoni TaxID=8153 RepID=A0A3Q2VCD2_HAPBU|nr:CD59 glycoprotein isoform X1 [Haplochromis burtoni]
MMSSYSLTTVVLRTDLRRELIIVCALRQLPLRHCKLLKRHRDLQGEDDMKLLLLLLCFGTLRVGSGLRCYKCQDYTGRCQDVQECTYEDSCISLSERGGKTIRQCIRYTDCDNSRLSQMFPAISAFTYRCCSSNLCNSGTACTAVTPLVALLGSLLSVWWCWM